MYWPEYDTVRRSRSKRRWLAPALLLGLAIGLFFGGMINSWWQLLPSDAGEGASEAAVGEPVDVLATAVPVSPGLSVTLAAPPAKAPDFDLTDLFDSSTIYSLADYAGRPLILNFWASWCVPCRVEMPALQQAYEKHKEAGLVVLGINQTYADSLDAAREFVKELGLTFSNARDDEGSISEKQYQILGLPTSVFITPAGEIGYRKIGQMSDQQVERFAHQLVTGEQVGP